MTTPFAEALLGSTGGAVADMALILLGTLAHCLSSEAAVNCFQQAARCACIAAALGVWGPLGGGEDGFRGPLG